MNANCWAWEPLKEEDLKDKCCWFVSCPGYTSFLLKQNWSDEVCRGLEGNGYNSAVKVHLHDAKMMPRKFLLDLTEDESAEWVNMGLLLLLSILFMVWNSYLYIKCIYSSVRYCFRIELYMKHGYSYFLNRENIPPSIFPIFNSQWCS